MTQSVWDIAIQQARNKCASSAPQDSTLLFVGNKSSDKQALAKPILESLLKSDSLPYFPVCSAEQCMVGVENKGKFTQFFPVFQGFDKVTCDTSGNISINLPLGKSSIINRFLDKDEKPKPTLALDYAFGRKGVANHPSRSVSHIYELGGGLNLVDLVDIVITPDNILNLTAILVIDLSRPAEIWCTVELLIQAIKARIDQMLKRLEQKNITTISTTLKDNLKKRIPNCHPDHELLDPLLIPLIMIGSKYDLLTFCTSKDEIMFKKLKTVFGHIAFGSSNVHYMQTELGKPLFIPVGSDSFSDIGAPPNIDLEVGRLTAKTPLDMWKAVFCSKFPQTPTAKTSLANTAQFINLPQIPDPGKDPQYAEPLVDNARKAKDEEWERLRRQGEKKMRDLLQQVTSDGLIIA